MMQVQRRSLPFVEAVIPQLSDVIWRTSCIFVERENKTAAGDLYCTRDSMSFITKDNAQMINVAWKNVKRIAKFNRRSLEKGIEISGDDFILTFTSVKNRDTIIDCIKIMTEAIKRDNRTFGFIKRDDIEVVKRLTAMKAPHIFEESLTSNLQDIANLVKSQELIAEYFDICGFSDVVISSWTKDKAGLTRSTSYTQRGFQSSTISSTQTIMKSGDSLVFEVVNKYTRPSTSTIMRVNVQFFFKQNEETTSFRGAYAVDYIKDTWDKEFVEASIARQMRIFYYFLKAKISNEAFDITEYDGQWRRHQPYVLVIIGLVIALLAMYILRGDANWYGYLFGSLLIFLFFYS